MAYEYKNTKMTDVKAAFDVISQDGVNKIYNYSPSVSITSHIQGAAELVASDGTLAFIISHNNMDADLGFYLSMYQGGSVYRYNDDNFDIGFNHPGAIQIIGDYMFTGVENGDSSSSHVRIYDVSGLRNSNTPSVTPCNYDMLRNESSGMAGIANYFDAELNDERYLLAIGNCKKVDFYRSSQNCDACHAANFNGIQFNPLFSFNSGLADDFNSFTLITEIGNAPNEGEFVYGLGFRTHSTTLYNKDYVDLYRINPLNRSIALVEQRLMYASHKYTHGVCGVHFRWGAGIYIENADRFQILATQRNFVAGRLEINTFR